VLRRSFFDAVEASVKIHNLKSLHVSSMDRTYMDAERDRERAFEKFEEALQAEIKQTIARSIGGAVS